MRVASASVMILVGPTTDRVVLATQKALPFIPQAERLAELPSSFSHYISTFKYVYYCSKPKYFVSAYFYFFLGGGGLILIFLYFFFLRYLQNITHTSLREDTPPPTPLMNQNPSGPLGTLAYHLGFGCQAEIDSLEI